MALDNRNLEAGTRLVGRYKKQDHFAEVVTAEDGSIRYRLRDGREFKSLSAAGSAVMGGVACNGWRFWSLVKGGEGGEAPEARDVDGGGVAAMEITAQERIETLEEVVEMMDECAAKLRSLGNPRIDAYCLADFEGRNGGWLGKFVRDCIEEELQEMRRELDENAEDSGQ